MEDNRSKIIPAYLVMLMVLIPLFNRNSIAQISFETYMENYYDDNIYNNSFKVEDFISSFSLNSGYNFESDLNNLQFYYMGNLSYYQKNIFKSSNSHKVGAVETYLFSEYDNPMNIGINYTWRNNREEFVIFDFNQLSAYANYRQTISEGKYLLFGYVLNKNNYKNFDVFSHFEHRIFTTGILSFESGTALTLGLKYNLKVYTDNIPVSTAANTNSQFVISSNISQSINNTTGINGYAAFRKNLKDGTRYLSSDEWIVYEEEIFNDIYSNEGYDLGLALTKYLSANILAKLEFSYSKRDYPSIPVPDAEGYDTDIMRKDDQMAGAVAVEFYLNSLIRGMSLELNWNYIQNKSNDPFYHYDNNLLSVGLNWGL